MSGGSLGQVAGIKREDNRQDAKVAEVAEVAGEKSRSPWRSWRLGASKSRGFSAFCALADLGAGDLLAVDPEHLEAGLVLGREDHPLRDEAFAEVARSEVAEHDHALAEDLLGRVRGG